MASRVAPPAMDPALGTDSFGPPEYGYGHPHTGEPDGRCESPLGSPSDPWRVRQSGRRGIGANRLAAPEATASPPITDVAHLSDESRRRADRVAISQQPSWRGVVRKRFNHLPRRPCRRRMVSIDFFTVPTLTGRVLFVFVVLRDVDVNDPPAVMHPPTPRFPELARIRAAPPRHARDRGVRFSTPRKQSLELSPWLYAITRIVNDLRPCLRSCDGGYTLRLTSLS